MPTILRIINTSISLKVNAFARRKTLVILLVGVLSFGGSWLVAAYRGIPIPYIHDEFSYLLAGDTFAHGRLTNPTHPMWEHFETFHELMRPTYMSKFPPGQGLFLALGQVSFGHPIYGVWLSAAFMCMAICWMLYAWCSPRWALVGGMVGVLQFGVFTYWSQSYWGGAVAALGGALVFGAWPRIFKYQRIRDLGWLGLGIALLVNSRPIEGILVGIPIVIMVLPWKIQCKEFKISPFIKKIVLPFILIFLLILIATGTYNKAVTGDACVFPHLLYDRTYTSIPHLLFESLEKSPHYHNKTMAQYEKIWTKKYFLQKKTWKGFIKDLKVDTRRIFSFYFGFPLATPSLIIVFLMLLRRQRFWRLAVVSGTMVSICILMTCIAKVHYFAPFTCWVVLFITYGLRCLLLSFPRHRLGVIMMALLMIFQVVFNVYATSIPQTVLSLGRIVHSSKMQPTFAFTREDLKNFLLKEEGKHLVIVNYLPKHSVHREWVYNDADIDRSRIVWARDLGADKNAKLLHYFKDRQVWQVEVFWDIGHSPLYDKR